MTETRPLKLCVLLSGSGTTLENLYDHVARRGLPAEIVKVIASKPEAYGIQRAKNHGTPHAVVPRQQFKGLEAFSAAVWEEIAQAAPDLVVLAGWMCLIRIPEKWLGRVINIHPALIPAFCGKGMYGHHVHQTVYERGVKLTGCTVHFADNEYDHGPIILQRAMPVEDDDTPETIAEKVQALEREAYPEAIRLLAEGRVTIEGQRTRIAPA